MAAMTRILAAILVGATAWAQGGDVAAIGKIAAQARKDAKG